MTATNQLTIEFSSLPGNLSFARVAIAAFASQLDFTMNELEEIKVIVSEAVSNAIIHGYENSPNEKVKIYALLNENELTMEIEDYGKGIEDIDKALEPAYTTDEERMGLGFVFIKSFTEQVNIESVPGKGTKIKLSKKAGAGKSMKNSSVN